MKRCAVVAGVLLMLSPVMAEGEADIQTVLPLFEKHSLERKILIVNYSATYELNLPDLDITHSGKYDVSLVFDSETGRYREEKKYYNGQDDAELSNIQVDMWNGEESVSWSRSVSANRGYRILGQGVYEHPGKAVIKSQSFWVPTPFASFYWDTAAGSPIAKVLPEQNPKLRVIGDTITIETKRKKFELSKRTGVLERLDGYSLGEDGERMTEVAGGSYEFSDYVERSGVWIPLQIVVTHRDTESGAWTKANFSVDPETLRLLDKVEDESIFNAVLPTGCYVEDEIRNRTYRAKTVGTWLTEALGQAREQMQELMQNQRKAEEQGEPW